LVLLIVGYQFRIECSVHKLIVGHNVYGGSDDLLTQVDYLRTFINKSLDINIGSVSEWIIQRLDFAKTFNLGTKENCVKYIQNISRGYYPRREISKFETSTYCKGTTTTVKIYHKGSEYYKHDRARLNKVMNYSEGRALQQLADQLIRVEVEFKNKKLKSILNNESDPLNDVLISQVNIKAIETSYYKEVGKMIKLVDDDVKTIRTMEKVEDTLIDEYGRKEGVAIFATWIKLSTQAYKKVLDDTPKSTFYRHRKKLLDMNIDWQQTDVILLEEDEIVDFIPCRNSNKLFHMDSPYMVDVLQLRKVG
jgi:II/X family phage/plasmid replication protein